MWYSPVVGIAFEQAKSIFDQLNKPEHKKKARKTPVFNFAALAQIRPLSGAEVCAIHSLALSRSVGYACVLFVGSAILLGMQRAIRWQPPSKGAQCALAPNGPRRLWPLRSRSSSDCCGEWYCSLQRKHSTLTQSRLCLTLRVFIRATEGIAVCRESYGCDWVDATL